MKAKEIAKKTRKLWKDYFDGEPDYTSEEVLDIITKDIEALIIHNVIMPTGKEGTVIPDLVGLCPSCGEEISRNGVFNKHNCKKG